MKSVWHHEQGNGAKPATNPHASPNGRNAGAAFTAAGRNGHGASASLLRLLRLRARSAARPGSRALTRRQLTHLSSWEELQVEIDRSRRYGHSFSIIRLTCPATKRAFIRKRGERRAEIERRAITVGLLLRRLDRVWAEGDDIYVLLPEGDHTMADAMLDRLGAPLAALAPGSEATVASFPQDGLSKGALLAALGTVTSRRLLAPALDDDDDRAVLPSPPEEPAPHAAG